MCMDNALEILQCRSLVHKGANFLNDIGRMSSEHVATENLTWLVRRLDLLRGNNQFAKSFRCIHTYGLAIGTEERLQAFDIDALLFTFILSNPDCGCFRIGEYSCRNY